MTIKVLGYRDDWTPYPFEYKPGYTFVRNGDSYDWLVVHERLCKPLALACDPQKTILTTWEPTSIKHYSTAYTRQFAHLLSNRPREAENHPHYHLGRGYFPWFIGRSYAEAATQPLPPKTKVISVVCSNKRMRHTEHDARYRLVKELTHRVPGLDWFGFGIREVARKSDALDPYKYHVALENHIANHHWTEKLTDAFLAECLPFYAGAPDLADDFPKESFIPIPMDDPARAAEIINKAIADGEYEKRLPAIREAKRLVLEKFNFWQQVIDIIEEAEATSPKGPSSVRLVRPGMLLPYTKIRWLSPSTAWEDGLWHLSQAMKRTGLWLGSSRRPPPRRERAPSPRTPPPAS